MLGTIILPRALDAVTCSGEAAGVYSSPVSDVEEVAQTMAAMSYCPAVSGGGGGMRRTESRRWHVYPSPAHSDSDTCSTTSAGSDSSLTHCLLQQLEHRSAPQPPLAPHHIETPPPTPRDDASSTSLGEFPPSAQPVSVIVTNNTSSHTVTARQLPTSLQSSPPRPAVGCYGYGDHLRDQEPGDHQGHTTHVLCPEGPTINIRHWRRSRELSRHLA